MIRLLGFGFVILSLFVSVATAHASKRVALIIGNSAYEHASKLTNPKNDADAIAEKLLKLDFDVVKGVDLTHVDFAQKVSAFRKKLVGADVGLFFYAGHGLQVDGENYLVPVDAELEDEASLGFETVPIKNILKLMEWATKTNLVFLDACRDNPLARNLARSMGTRSTALGRGLARLETGLGTMISFATQPGNVALDGSGKNSPFTTALLKHIDTPGLDVAQLMRRVRVDVIKATSSRQVPWSNSSLTGDFYFYGPVTVNVAPSSKNSDSYSDEMAALKNRLKELEGQLKKQSASAPTPDNNEKSTLQKPLGQKPATLRGHTDNVNSVAFSPDGKHVLTGSNDALIHLWDVKTRTIRRTFVGHAGHVKSVAFSPDGKTILTGSEDNTARLWDVRTGRLLKSIAAKSILGLDSVDFAPNGESFLTHSSGGWPKLWDAQTGTLIRQFKTRHGVIASTFSPDGSTLLFGHTDHTASLWDRRSGKKIRSFKGHKRDIYAVDFSPDGKKIATGGSDNVAKIWDVKTSNVLATLKGHKLSVHGVAFSPDGERLVTVSPDSIRLWNARTGQLIAVDEPPEGKGLFMDVAFSPNGINFVTASLLPHAKIWAIENQRLVSSD